LVRSRRPAGQGSGGGITWKGTSEKTPGGGTGGNRPGKPVPWGPHWRAAGASRPGSARSAAVPGLVSPWPGFSAARDYSWPFAASGGSAAPAGGLCVEFPATRRGMSPDEPGKEGTRWVRGLAFRAGRNVCVGQLPPQANPSSLPRFLGRGPADHGRLGGRMHGHSGDKSVDKAKGGTLTERVRLWSTIGRNEGGASWGRPGIPGSGASGVSNHACAFQQLLPETMAPGSKRRQSLGGNNFLLHDRSGGGKGGGRGQPAANEPGREIWFGPGPQLIRRDGSGGRPGGTPVCWPGLAGAPQLFGMEGGSRGQWFSWASPGSWIVLNGLLVLEGYSPAGGQGHAPPGKFQFVVQPHALLVSSPSYLGIRRAAAAVRAPRGF